ncbi:MULTISPECIES: hypothetical protein [Cohnella]|uniref:hypothetical protein n=1 Tax=Cohnella TaxID=329857 RepID=UPI0003A57EF1|nr:MULTISPECIES: hypothetical protein [Cohnella]
MAHRLTGTLQDLDYIGKQRDCLVLRSTLESVAWKPCIRATGYVALVSYNGDYAP